MRKDTYMCEGCSNSVTITKDIMGSKPDRLRSIECGQCGSIMTHEDY